MIDLIEELISKYMNEFLEFWTPVLMLSIGAVVFVLETAGGMRAAYGRYNIKNSGLSAPIAWLIQECPAFLIPLGLLLYRGVYLYDKFNRINTNLILLGFFMIHYFNRFKFGFNSENLI